MPLLLRDAQSCAWAPSQSGPDADLAQINSFPWSSPGPASPNLCSVCGQIKFSSLVQNQFQETDLEWVNNQSFRRLSGGIKLGLWGTIITNVGECEFCGLIKEYVDGAGSSGDIDPDNTEVWLQNERYTAEGRCDHPFYKSKPSSQIQVIVSFRPADPEWTSLDASATPETVFSFRLTPSDRHNLGPDTKRSPVTNFGEKATFRLLQWFDACQQTRKRTPHSSFWPDLHEGLQLSSRIIDLRGRRIIPAPPDCRYVALSYVWGKKNFFQLRRENVKAMLEPHSIDNLRLPKTIKDAMALCNALGERYLWIDSLCIVQDTDDKHMHMVTMEAIYRGAVLTIAIAAGSHADHGIPGFGTSFKSFPQARHVQTMWLAAPKKTFRESVDSSLWNTRAWTYQERLFSNRLIIFTDDEIYFQCGHGRVQGDMALDPHDTAYVAPQALGLDSYRIKLEEQLNFSLYTRIVREYMGRRLTHEYDIENAFGGARKIFCLIFGGSEVLFGMPLSILALGLLWYSEEPLQRRVRGAFPSWSWVGWIGRIEYPTLLLHAGERLLLRAKFADPLNRYRHLPNESFGPPAKHWEGRTRWLRQMSTEKEFYYTKRGNHTQPDAIWYSYPMEPMFHDPIPINRETGSLYLFAKLATFNAVASSQLNGRQLELYDANSVQCGRVRMDELQDWTLGATITVMAVSQTTLKAGDEDPAWSDTTASYSQPPGAKSWTIDLKVEHTALPFDPAVYDPKTCWCLYNVLVVTTLNQGGRAMRRHGIGQIHIKAFDDMATSEELIELR
jgi:hypothetical protein